MKREDIKQILEKINNEDLSKEEKSKALLWLFQLDQHTDTKLSEDQIKTARTEIWSKLNINNRKKPVFHFKLWMYAAAILFVVFTGSILYYNLVRSPINNQLAQQHDIAPGKDGATLILADGSKIAIGEIAAGEVMHQRGVTISKGSAGELVYEVNGQSTDDNSFNTLQTKRSEQIKILLPDGTNVYLNAESSLRYPTNFNNDPERKVYLQGEGYFQVKEDRKHPFKVVTPNETVEVLGTHFNINTYTLAASVTTLEEGSVKISNKNASKVIKPGEQAVNTNNGLLIQKADLDQVLGWKNGNFVFSGVPMATVIDQIERWYDVEIIYEGPAMEGLLYANISRKKKLSEVLKTLKKTTNLNFKIEGRRVIMNL